MAYRITPLGDFANSLMSAAVAVALCVGCANEPDEPAAAPEGSAAPRPQRRRRAARNIPAGLR
jgi:hypothetical protein